MLRARYHLSCNVKASIPTSNVVIASHYNLGQIAKTSLVVFVCMNVGVNVMDEHGRSLIIISTSSSNCKWKGMIS